MKDFVQRITRGSLWFSIGTAATKVVALAVVLVILRQLSVYEYGLLELVLSILPLASFALLPGVDQLVITEMGAARGRGDSVHMKSIFVQYIKLQVLIGAVVFVAIFLGSQFIAATLDAKGLAPNLIALLSFNFLIAPWRSAAVVLLSVYWKFRSQTIFSVAEEASKLLIVVLSLFVFDFGLPGVVLANVLDSALAVLILVPALIPLLEDFRGIRSEPGSMWSLIKGPGLWTIFGNYFNNFGANMRLWLIKLFLGTEAVGLYAVASGLYSNTLGLIPLSRLMSQVIPQYVNMKERFELVVAKAIKYQMLAYALLAAAALIVFPPIILFLFPKYADSLPLFRILLLALIPASFGSIIVPVFYSLRRQRNLFYAIILKDVLILVLLPLCATLFGVLGIAIEQVLTASIYTVERTRMLKRILPDLPHFIRYIFTIDDTDRMVLSTAWGSVFSRSRK